MMRTTKRLVSEKRLMQSCKYGDFRKMCEERGFSKQGTCFARCIGDGVYQKIGVVFDDRSLSVATAHTSKSRVKELRIGLWPMYSSLPEWYFDDDRHYGGYYAENLLGRKFSGIDHADIDAEYLLMMEEGFDVIDTINTQAKLMSTKEELWRLQDGFVPRHQLDMCAPYLLNGEYDRALDVLYGLYAQNWYNFHSQYDYLKREKRYEKFVAEEDEFERWNSDVTSLLRLVLGKRREEIIEYFVMNMERNIQYAKKNKIHIEDSVLSAYPNLLAL